MLNSYSQFSCTLGRDTEEVFDALMLNTPTLKGLREAVSFQPLFPLHIFAKISPQRGIVPKMWLMSPFCLLRFQKSTVCKKTPLGKSSRSAKEGEWDISKINFIGRKRLGSYDEITNTDRGDVEMLFHGDERLLNPFLIISISTSCQEVKSTDWVDRRS